MVSPLTLNSRMGVVGNQNLAAGFLLGPTLLAMAVFIWVVWSQRCKLKVFKRSVIESCSAWTDSISGVQRAHNCLLALFIVDIVNAIAGIIVGIGLVAHPNGMSDIYSNAFVVWFLSRWLGQFLHLYCALVSILHLCNSELLSGSKQHSFWVAIIIFLFVLIPLYVYINMASIFGLVFIIFFSALSILVKSMKLARSPSATKKKKQFVCVSMFTFLVIFIPSFIPHCLIITSNIAGESADHYEAAFLNALFFTNFQLCTDGLLSYFILQLPEEDEDPQPQFATRN